MELFHCHPDTQGGLKAAEVRGAVVGLWSRAVNRYRVVETNSQGPASLTRGVKTVLNVLNDLK